ncbi:hypothetical protein AX14_003602 [Amanita brunnescens Koide BX004]|nr:hypothetical protein AX14_003602 [Amanita brunnescens Koide BX004]
MAWPALVASCPKMNQPIAPGYPSRVLRAHMMKPASTSCLVIVVVPQGEPKTNQRSVRQARTLAGGASGARHPYLSPLWTYVVVSCGAIRLTHPLKWQVL